MNKDSLIFSANNRYEKEFAPRSPEYIDKIAALVERSRKIICQTGTVIGAREPNNSNKITVILDKERKEHIYALLYFSDLQHVFTSYTDALSNTDENPYLRLVAQAFVEPLSRRNKPPSHDIRHVNVMASEILEVKFQTYKVHPLAIARMDETLELIETSMSDPYLNPQFFEQADMLPIMLPVPDQALC